MQRLATKLVCLAALFVASGAVAAPPADLDRYAQKVLQTFGTPGMTVAIVEQGKPYVVRSYGVRRMGEPAKVDEHTLFAIGSTTKAFTTALLAMLVDEGKVTWETKVADVLPGFKMYDPYVSSEMTIRDIVVHRSGLGPGAGDLMFFPPTTLTRADIIHRLRYIKPVTSFRSSFAYDNLLYIVAGEAIATVEKSSWEDTIRKRILAPLQMIDTTTTSTLPAGANRAWPHARASQEMRGLGPMSALAEVTSVDVAAAAGALNSNGIEIARWLELQLNAGMDAKSGTRLFSEAQSREMWTPQTLLPIAPAPPRLELAKGHFRAYALGWGLGDYRGQTILSHAGGVPGMVTLFVLVPEKHVAFALFTNAEEPGVLTSMQYRLLDHYLGLKSPDWITAVSETFKERLAKGREQLAASKEQGKDEPVRGPSLPLEKYEGRYRDAWYGTVTIERDGEGMKIRFDNTPSMSGKLEHVRYDTFRTRWTDKDVENAYVTFALKPDGSIERMTMQAISPLADFSYDFGDLMFAPERP
ncbi:MAG TPA: serine hydrolase [Steroidobacteraceae bacterium]|nr:serine hydrolase [Steroidobacteraceae bacterium]